MKTIERVPLIVVPGGRGFGVRAKGYYKVRAWNPVLRPKTGSMKGWEYLEREIHNLVVNQGLDDLLSVHLAAGTQDTTWFGGLTDGTPTTAAADTLASHSGWTEVTAYDETNRQAFVPGSVSGQSVDNTGSPFVFTINANGTTVGGMLLAGVNTGTSGRLYSVGAFSDGDLVLNDGAELTGEATFTMAAA